MMSINKLWAVSDRDKEIKKAVRMEKGPLVKYEIFDNE